MATARKIPKTAGPWKPPPDVIVGPEEMVTGWLLVTPDMALEAYALTDTKAQETLVPLNRRRRKPVAVSYNRDMAKGTWQPHHQGIAFSRSGDVRDGQHRLCGIADSGVAQWLMVTWNLPDVAMLVVDSGIRRTAEDSINLSGGDTNFREIGIARRMQQRDGQLAMTNAETDAFMATYSGGIDFVVHTMATKTISVRHAMSAGVGGAIASAWYHVPEAKLARFCWLLMHSKAGPDDGPEHASVFALADALRTKRFRRPQEVFAKTLRMIQAYMAGNVVNKTHPRPNIAGLYRLPESVVAVTKRFTPPLEAKAEKPVKGSKADKA